MHADIEVRQFDSQEYLQDQLENSEYCVKYRFSVGC